MAKILIVYATRQGQSGKIAQHVAGELEGQGHSVYVFNTEHPSLYPQTSTYDGALVIAPIHAGGYPKSLVRFVAEHNVELTKLPAAFCSVGLAVASKTSDGRKQTMPIVEKFLAKTGWKPTQVELVAGALPYSKYNFLVRFMMRRIAAHEGGDTDTSHDYEYTDWAALDRFTSSFVTDVVPRTTARIRRPA